MPTSTNQSEIKVDQKPNVHPIGSSKGRNRRHSAGFSLVELLVAISVILLLVGIGAVVAVRMNVEARRVQIRAMLDGLKGAQDEFVAKRQQGKINHSGSYPIDWGALSGNPSLSSSERLVYGCQTIKAADDMMMAALRSGPEGSFDIIYKDADNNSYYEIYDRWGTEIEYRSSNGGNGTGPKTGIANNLLPSTPGVILVSAGPDQEFGTDDDIHTDQN